MKKTLCGIILAISVIAGANGNTDSKDNIGYQLSSMQADSGKIYPPKPVDIGGFLYGSKNGK